MSNIYLITNEAWALINHSEHNVDVLNKALNINIHIPAFVTVDVYDGIVIVSHQLSYIEALVEANSLDDKEVIILSAFLEHMSDSWWTVENIKREGCVKSI